jgi:hypothetical protein
MKKMGLACLFMLVAQWSQRVTALLPGSTALGNVQSLTILPLERRQPLPSARQFCANDELNSHRRQCLNVQTVRERNGRDLGVRIGLRTRQATEGWRPKESLFGASLSSNQTWRQMRALRAEC